MKLDDYVKFYNKNKANKNGKILQNTAKLCTCGTTRKFMAYDANILKTK